jgi:hypothetical protein
MSTAFFSFIEAGRKAAIKHQLFQKPMPWKKQRMNALGKAFL